MAGDTLCSTKSEHIGGGTVDKSTSAGVHTLVRNAPAGVAHLVAAHAGKAFHSVRHIHRCREPTSYTEDRWRWCAHTRSTRASNTSVKSRDALGLSWRRIPEPGKLASLRYFTG
jgi:hypothetical protein